METKITKNSERFQLFMTSSAIGIGIIFYLLMSMIYSRILGAIYNSLDYDTYKRLTDSSVFQNGIYIIYAMFCIALPFLAVHFIMRIFSREKLFLNKPQKGRGLFSMTFIGLGMCVLGNYAATIFTVVIEALFKSTPTGAPSDVTSASQISFVGFLVSIVSTAMVPALVEEFAMRGVVMQPLRRFGDKFAVVISSLVFSLIHGNFEQIPFAFVVGLALGYVVIRANSLWAGVLLHFLNNFWAVCTEYLSYLAPQTVTAIVYYSTNVVVCVIAIICAVRLYKKDVKNGITSGILEKPNCITSGVQKTLLVFYSPTFLLGAGYLIYTALQNFVKV